LINHRIDGVLQLENFALYVDGDLLRQVAVRDGGGHLSNITYLAGQVTGHRVHGVGEVLPGAGHAQHVRVAAELAFGADLADHERHLRRERGQLVHHRVDGVLEFEDFAAHVDGDLLRQVAVRDGGGHIRNIPYLAGEVGRHRVHGVGEVFPGAA